MDKARKKTDKILHAMEKEIGRVYSKSPALSRVMADIEEYMEYVDKATESSYKAYIEESDISVKEEKKKAYMSEIRRYTIESKIYRELVKAITQELSITNQEALDIINASMPKIYSINYNQVTAECRRAGIEVKNKFDYLDLMGANKDELVSFTLLDESTVKRLIADGEVKVPRKKVNIPKDEQWNMKTLGSKLLQGMQNGDSIPKIADSFEEVIGSNRASAVRNARTMTTSAECHGRMDSYESLAKQGVIQKKHWIATGDNRTRDTHLALDGQERDIDEAFSNGLMFPGDASGEPSEIWNCRCSIASKIVGFKKADGHIDYVRDVKEPESTHEKQIREEKEKRGKTKL